MLHVLAEILTRAVSLLALAAAPPFISPEPLPSAMPMAEGAVAAVMLAAVVVAAVRFRRRVPAHDALAGSALLIAAVVASIACAAVFRGPQAPLGRGVLWVAAPLWAGLAVIAGAVAERGLGPSFKNKRVAGMAAVLCLGAVLLRSQSVWLFEPKQMWWQALKKDGDNNLAAERILRDVPMRDHRGAINLLDRCLLLSPGACACLARRAQIGARMGSVEQAIKDGHEAVALCPSDPVSHTSYIVALAGRDAIEAEVEAKNSIALRDDPRYHYGLAFAYDRQGKTVEAMEEVKKAVAGNAGRDASLLLGALAINAGDLETAQKTLAPLVAANANDADALYDLALIDDRNKKYNEARQGYLAALRADPSFLDARYNLVFLTINNGVLEEGKHHARKFAELAPQDPRNAGLAQLIATATPRK